MKKLFIALIVLALVILAGTYFFFNYSGKAAGKLKADHQIDAVALYEAYSSDETAGNQKYLDKILEVRGAIIDKMEDEQGSVVLILGVPNAMSGVMCTLIPDERADDRQVGDSVSVRGRCTGMLTDVVLNQCVILP